MEDISIKLSWLYKTRKFAVFCIVFFWLSILYLLYLYSNSFTFIREKEFVLAVITTSVIIVWWPIQLLYRFFDKNVDRVIDQTLWEHLINYTFVPNQKFDLLRKKNLFNWNIHWILFEWKVSSVETWTYSLLVREIIQGYHHYTPSGGSYGIGKWYYTWDRITDHFLLREITYNNKPTEEKNQKIEYFFHSPVSNADKQKKLEQNISQIFKYLWYFFLFALWLIGVISLLRFLFVMDNQILLWLFILLSLLVLIYLFRYLAKNTENKLETLSISDLISQFPWSEKYRFLLEKLWTNIQITTQWSTMYIKQNLFRSKLFYISRWFSPSKINADINRYISLIEWMKKNVHQIYWEDK